MDPITTLVLFFLGLLIGIGIITLAAESISLASLAINGGRSEEERLREKWTTTEEREEAAKDFEARHWALVDRNPVAVWIYIERSKVMMAAMGHPFDEIDDLGGLLGFEGARTEMECIIRCNNEEITETARGGTPCYFWANYLLPSFYNSAKEYFRLFSEWFCSTRNLLPQEMKYRFKMQDREKMEDFWIDVLLLLIGDRWSQKENTYISESSTRIEECRKVGLSITDLIAHEVRMLERELKNEELTLEVDPEEMVIYYSMNLEDHTRTKGIICTTEMTQATTSRIKTLHRLAKESGHNRIIFTVMPTEKSWRIIQDDYWEEDISFTYLPRHLILHDRPTDVENFLYWTIVCVERD